MSRTCYPDDLIKAACILLGLNTVKTIALQLLCLFHILVLLCNYDTICCTCI